ncbi:polysaccharide deacetylase family protein [Cumulibacter manganitolerans]|uniref:polysaccharide deacetylase family protein n=1 Tax=Cumulibacter manganitolerans TaxID=1884992 RepID=UPI0012971CAF|nr:polysaccharide deacetylase [Cumulibacter manganitolerans]
MLPLRPQRRSSTAALIIAAILLLAAACTTNAPRVAAGTSATAAPSTADPAAGLVAKAARQAAQYDYDAAIATLSAGGSAAAKKELAAVQAAKAQAVTWRDNSTIPHLFYHSLIVDPARAFGAGTQGVGFNQYMVTVSEFTKQLQQMYDKGWVMVHPERIAAPGPDGAMAAQPIVLAPGKKPFVLSIDDVNYYEFMSGKGFATNLVVKGDGRVVNTYTNAAGATTEGSYDVMPIVDDFVREHPDFAYRGDKGSIAVTGYNGVLGYRSSVQTYGDTQSTKSAQQKAKTAADALKNEGWNFASHSWGHINMTTQSLARITDDAQRWDAEVRPIVGDTRELVFPFGADLAGIEHYGPGNAKFSYLHDAEKFTYYFGVNGATLHWMQLDPSIVRQARINVDGISMQRVLDGKKSPLPEFFDVQSTIDPKRPLPVPSSGGPKAGGG